MSSTHYLHKLFAPKSIAVIGASDRPHSIGQTVFANLLAEGGPAKLFPVNLRHRNVAGMHAASSVAELSAAPDLAVAVTPPATYESVIRDCKKAGVHYVVLIKSSDEISAEDYRLTERAFALAKRLEVRLLGPSFLGMIRPSVFHAATYNHAVRRGNIALIGQSSSLCSVMLDWAQSRGIGFSAVLAFGEGGTDIGFGEVLDYLVHDKATMGILLHIQNVPSGRKLMSALRAAARMKPVIVLKSGKSRQILPEGSGHVALPVPGEEVFSSALERAGVLQMDNFSQIFTAARILAASYRTAGSRLAVITNGAGLGLMALDATVGTVVEAAEFSEKTRKALERALPNSEVCNPLDIRANAGPLRYRTVTKLCLDDPQIDGVLVIFSPQTTDVDHFKTAQMMVQLQKETAKPLLLSWLGGSGITPARDLFAHNKCLSFNAPEYAVEAFANLVRFQRNQQLLRQIAKPLRYKRLPADFQAARSLIRQAADAAQNVLPEHTAKQLLECFHIPGNKTLYASDAEEACIAARQTGYPVVMKIDSPDIVHKSNVGGVALNLHSARECREAFARIMENVRNAVPAARIDGVSIQKMLPKTHTRVVKITVTQDAVFGPVIALCAGGDTHIHQDRAIALPPLNEEIIERMIRGVRISRTFGGYRNMPPIDRSALIHALSGISEMVCEFPEIRGLKADILLYPDRALVFDARASLDFSVRAANRYAHMAIMPYPQYLEQKMTLKNGADVLIRPIREEDAALVQNFVRNLSDESRYNRFMSSIKQLSDNVLLRFTQLDYDREIALAMIHTAENGEETLLGVSRYVTDPDMEVCEFAVSVADNWQGNGIASILMNLLFQAARDQGLQTMRGEVLTSNSAMQGLVRKLGFSVRKDPEDDGITLVVKDLRGADAAVADNAAAQAGK